MQAGWPDKGEAAGSEEFCSLPSVSYTHLDVYKRQIWIK